MKNRQRGVRDSPGTHRASGRGGAPAFDSRQSPGGREIFQLFHGIHQRNGCSSPSAIKPVFGLNAAAVWAKAARSEVQLLVRFLHKHSKSLEQVQALKSGKHFLLPGFLTCPVVFFQQKQEKGRIHLNLMLKYLQGDEAKGTVRKRDRWRLKTLSVSRCPLHTHYTIYIAWSCAVQENKL